MVGQFELGGKHLECIKKAQELILQVEETKTRNNLNPKGKIKEYLGKIDNVYDDYLGMAVTLEEIAKQDSLSAYILADQIIFNELMKLYGSCKTDAVLDKGETISLLCLEPGYSTLEGIQSKATKTPSGWQITGTKLISSEQIYSEKYLIFAKDEQNNIRLFPVFEDKIRINEINTTVSSSKITLNQVEINTELKDDACIGVIGDNFERIHTIARTLIASIAVGVAHSALITSIHTAKDTKNAQGESISSSQSLQFTLADMFSEIEGSRMLAYYSADSIDKGKPSIKIASMAKVKASEAAASSSMETLHILGNIGFVANADLSLIQRAIDSEVKGGTNRTQRSQIYQYMLAKK